MRVTPFMAKRLWLYLHFHQLTLDNATRTGGVHEAVPTAVYQSNTNQLVQVNACAKNAGIEKKMGLAQAAALCEHLEIIDYNETAETTLLQQLAAHLYQCAAEVALVPPQGLVVRIDNLVRFYGEYAVLWQAINAVLLTQQVTFNYASAWSPEAAEALAIQSTNQLITDTSVQRQFISALPVSGLLIHDKYINALHRAGIKRVSDLLALPATEIGKRFDTDLLKYLFALRGESHPTLRFYYPPATFEHELILPYDIEDTIRLQPYIDKCLDDLGVFLRLRNAGTQCITLVLHFRENAPLSLAIRKADGRFSKPEWQRLMALKLETVTLTAPVTHFILLADELFEYAGIHGDFFNNRKHFFARQQLLGKLTARLGEQAIAHPQWPVDHRITKTRAESPAEVDKKRYSPLPAFTLPEPIALHDSPKIEFGPIRVESGWWDTAPQQRDYFIALNGLGQRLQIFREGGRWFLNGWYA